VSQSPCCAGPGSWSVFVMANERRSTYDYFMMVCGPIPFARCTLAPTGPVELIASDGAFLDEPASPVLQSCASNASSG
jgi:hypothetical protein